MGSSVFHIDSIQYSQAVAAKVDAARETAGLSVLALSEQSGVARSTLDRKLKGVGDFTVREIKALATALGLTAADLTVIHTATAAA